MLVLVVAIAILLAPPFFAERLGQRPGVAGFVDGVVLGGIAALVVFDVLPEAAAADRTATVVGLFVGLLFPALAERSGFGGHEVDGASLVVGQLALALHAALDGASLGTGDVELIGAVLLHQAPVGLAIWASTRARFGVGPAWGALLVMGATTALGYAAGEGVFARADASALAGFQALAAGTLLHVVGHGETRDLPARPSGIGALLAAGAVAAVPGPHVTAALAQAPYSLVIFGLILGLTRSYTNAARITTLAFAVGMVVTQSHATPATGWRIAAAGLWVGLVAASLLRVGPRGWLHEPHHH